MEWNEGGREVSILEFIPQMMSGRKERRTLSFSPSLSLSLSVEGVSIVVCLAAGELLELLSSVSFIIMWTKRPRSHLHMQYRAVKMSVRKGYNTGSVKT